MVSSRKQSIFKASWYCCIGKSQNESAVFLNHSGSEELNSNFASGIVNGRPLALPGTRDEETVPLLTLSLLKFSSSRTSSQELRHTCFVTDCFLLSDFLLDNNFCFMLLEQWSIAACPGGQWEQCAGHLRLTWSRECLICQENTGITLWWCEGQWSAWWAPCNQIGRIGKSWYILDPHAEKTPKQKNYLPSMEISQDFYKYFADLFFLYVF